MAREDIQQRTLVTLAATSVLSGVGVVSTVAAGGLLVAGITGRESLAGLAQTFNVLGAAAMAIPLARLTRRGGRRLALGTGYAIATVGSLSAIVGGVHSVLVLMLAGTFLLGASSASNYQARFAAVDLSQPEHRAQDLSYVVWASTIGAVLGPNLMAPFGELAVGVGMPRLTGPYLLAFAMLLLGALTITLRLRPDPYTLSVERLTHATGEAHAALSTRQTLTLIRSIPRAWVGMLSVAIGHVAMVSVMVMTPVHMAHVDVSLRVIGLVISVHVAGMYALSPVVGRAADTYGRLAVVQCGVVTLLAAALIAGRAAPDSAVQLGVGLFLLGVGWSCTMIGGSTLLAESISAMYKASAQGTNDLVMNLAAAGGGALAGLIISVWSYGWLCAIAAVPVAWLGIKTARVAAAE